MKKKIPTFRTDEEAERFVDTADLSEYDLSGGRLVRFEFEKKDTRFNMRLPESLLAAVKARAKARGGSVSAVHSRGAGTGGGAGVRNRSAHDVLVNSVIYYRNSENALPSTDSILYFGRTASVDRIFQTTSKIKRILLTLNI